jgi:glucosylceramidase
MALAPGGLSTWGWPQNSLLTIDPITHSVTRNPEYYVLKHYSAAVRPGAVQLAAAGRFAAQGSAYANPDGSLAVVVQNALDRPEPFTFLDPDDPRRSFTAELPARSLNTFDIFA